MASPDTITGTWSNPDGSAVANGYLYLNLSQAATITGTSQIAPTTISFQLTAAGALPSNSQIYGNDQLNPTGTVYYARVTNAAGQNVWAQTLSITGSSPINLNNAVPVNPNLAVTVLQISPGPITLASSATSAQTATFPNNTGTVAELNLNQTWSGTQTFNSAVFNTNTPIFYTASAYEEGSTPYNGTGTDYIWGDSGTHRLKMNNNSGTTQSIGGVVASSTATMASGSISGASCASVITVLAANVLTTDAIEWSYATAPSGTTDALLTIAPYVTAGNVNFIRCNPTAGSITGTAIVLNWVVVR